MLKHGKDAESLRFQKLRMLSIGKSWPQKLYFNSWEYVGYFTVYRNFHSFPWYRLHFPWASSVPDQSQESITTQPVPRPRPPLSHMGHYFGMVVERQIILLIPLEMLLVNLKDVRQWRVSGDWSSWLPLACSHIHCATKSHHKQVSLLLLPLVIICSHIHILDWPPCDPHTTMLYYRSCAHMKVSSGVWPVQTENCYWPHEKKNFNRQI